MKQYKQYDVSYRERGNKGGMVFHTSITALNGTWARKLANEEFVKERYTVVSVRKEL